MVKIVRDAYTLASNNSVEKLQSVEILRTENNKDTFPYTLYIFKVVCDFKFQKYVIKKILLCI